MEKNKLKELIKKQVREGLQESESLFKIDPTLAFKIWGILKKDIPEFEKLHPIKSAFFHYLNKNL